ncbi:MAG: type I-E CRISPR-associated protein Cse1/CasA [Gammaproteobacteria bacterium]|nr:MAG: type I-E CRISPR-associated protein Cse1/CasA [Gammaproteobacteria bacterium]
MEKRRNARNAVHTRARRCDVDNESERFASMPFALFPFRVGGEAMSHDDPWNLLTAPLIRIHTDTGMTRASLPQVLAGLGEDRIEDFPGLQRHQRDPWHLFLTQLATMALDRQGLRDPCQNEAFWRRALLELSHGEASAWRLVERNLESPAFLQTPWPKSRGAPSAQLFSSDALDALQTAKNHELKSARNDGMEVDLWLYALMSLQTTSGYSGPGNHGIARMNSGFGSRIILELVRNERWSIRFCDAVRRLFDHRQVILQGPNRWGYQRGGKALLWLDPWDGTNSRPLAGLDPSFIEICRIVRLFHGENGRLVAAKAPTKRPLLDAKAMGGVVGDPWTPVRIDQAPPKALTLNENGFTAEWQRRLLFADGVELSPLQSPIPDWSESCLLTASVIVRGQGRTDGLHFLRIPIPAKARSWIFGNKRASLNDRTKAAIQAAGEVERSALKPAVLAWLQGAPEQLSFDGPTVHWWKKVQGGYTRAWHVRLFPWLWKTAERSEQEAIHLWQGMIAEDARRSFRIGIETLPSPSAQRWKAYVTAECILEGAMRNRMRLIHKSESREGTHG